MKATEANLMTFLKKAPQFSIPIYQRTYSWLSGECQQLWDDILRAGRNEEISAHFIGSIVYIEKGLGGVIAQSPLLVIDGQQRLTTISLLLEALARNLGDREPIEGFSAAKIRHYYLLNSLEAGERQYKLLLTQTDKDSLLALVKQRPWPKELSIRIKENFEFFVEKIQSLGNGIEPLCNGLSKLMIVDVSLQRNQDNPQLIFESMNSTGRELSQADLIRNFILMGLDPDLQTQLYEDHWRPMEVEFGQEAYGVHFDRFMRHYLTLKTGEIPNIDKVYESFKAHARSSKIEGQGVTALVADIHAYADYYCCMALGKEKSKKLAAAFKDLVEFRVDVVYPFLLELYQDYKDEVLSEENFAAAVRLVESYVFRRAICNIPTNSLNKTFATLSRQIKKDRYLECIQAHLLLLPTYRRFPNDEEFMRELKVRDLYNFPRRSYWLRRLENYGRKESVSLAEYTIEHIMPQKEQLTDEWRAALGTEWERIHETWLHTLGNLTLTGYNSELGYYPFPTKRDMEGGFRSSPLKLNDGLGNIEVWDENAIKNRADKLARMATKVWAYPELSSEALIFYEQRPQRRAEYTIDDHPYLSSANSLRPVFEAFRKAVLAMDPVVTEEFLKLYIAYKAETNFVDVEAQAKRLRLSLNMAFHEINDPKGICRDVTGKGRWGNGDVEVGLKSLDDLPYVIGLVRQAFEKQMGNGDNG